MLLINNFFVFAQMHNQRSYVIFESLKVAVDDPTGDAVNNSNKTWNMLIICGVQNKYYWKVVKALLSSSLILGIIFYHSVYYNI